MTTLVQQTMTMESADFGKESCLPAIAAKLSLDEMSKNYQLDEDDGLFLQYGEVESVYPYKAIDQYSEWMTFKEYPVAILENDLLRATFMPTLGGKLWSLFDKKADRELLFVNSVVRPRNLGVRNAWLSGGIEWNMGFRGHYPYTCSPVNMAQAHLEDGTPVLRFYYFERIRCMVVQMDFFLPEGSHFLCSRVRITNPNDKVTPVYWWSNAGVGYEKGDRIVVPADQSYTAPNGQVMKIEIPEHHGIDVTYPHKNITSNDFFWKNDLRKRRYTAKLDEHGYGLFEASTSLLQGRKLFVWGNSQGGSKWMNFLTASDRSGVYAEMQSGLARTQYECLPMPPHTVWEWIEVYGAMQADPAKVHGTWAEARQEVEDMLDRRFEGFDLEALLRDTRAMAKSPADAVLMTMGDGWGALEEYRRKTQHHPMGLMNSHLDFGSMGKEQADWISLLERGTVGVHEADAEPVSYMRQGEWLTLLEGAVSDQDKDNWYAHYLLGTAHAANENYARAEAALARSLHLQETAWAYYALSVCKKRTGDKDAEIEMMRKAYARRQHNLPLVKEWLRCLYENMRSDETIRVFEGENAQIRSNERCLLYYAYALARVGRLDEAEKILCGEDGKTYLVVPDVRECELTITQLWVYIHEQRGMTRQQMGEPPYDLDFRMFAAREGWM